MHCMEWTPRNSIWMPLAAIVLIVASAQSAVAQTMALSMPTNALAPGASVGPGIVPGGGFGGPASPPVQLRTDQADGPTFRFPGLDRPLDPWMRVKKRLAEKRFLVGGDYNILYQGVSESLTGNKDALGQVFRVQGDWTLFGEADVSEGSIIFKGENRSAIGTDIAPRDIGFESGYLGSPGIVFSDAGWFLANLYWQQAIAGRVGIVIGRMEPDSFVDVSGYASPWPGFKNAGILVNNTVPFPALGLGAAAGVTFNDQWVVKGGLYDANGSPQSYKPYSEGGEFFSHLELSWAPSRAERFNKEIHITAWHIDPREKAGAPESHGMVLSGTWTFDEVWMPFFRAGWAEGGAPLMRRGVLAGLLKYCPYRGDLAGIGFSWEDPSDRSLREQKTIELFYNYRISKRLWISPSLQVFVDPALNPNDDVLTLFGCNARITY